MADKLHQSAGQNETNHVNWWSTRVGKKYGIMANVHVSCVMADWERKEQLTNKQ